MSSSSQDSCIFWAKIKYEFGGGGGGGGGWRVQHTPNRGQNYDFFFFKPNTHTHLIVWKLLDLPYPIIPTLLSIQVNYYVIAIYKIFVNYIISLDMFI